VLDDIKTAYRSLRSSSAFTLVALTVLSLGIGSGTAMFSVIDAVVLRGLPFDEYDRLGVVYGKDTKRAVTFGERQATSQTFLDWRAAQQPFQQITAVSGTQFRLRTEGTEPADARATRVTWEFFPVLRVTPALGRPFNADDEIDGERHVTILSYGFWQRRFGGSPDALGRTIDLNETPYQVVGVMPRSFSYPVGSNRASDLFVPQPFGKSERTKAGGHNYTYTIIGRLKDGMSMAQANERMWHLSEQLETQNPKWEPGRRARVVTLSEHLLGQVRGWMLMLLGAVVLVLLIACANVANLMLVRATARSREMSVRAALGASPGRLVRVLLVEGVLLSVTGALLGLVLASAGVAVLRAWLPAGLPRISTIAIDGRVLAVAISAAVLTGIVFGIVPAFQSARPDLTAGLKEGARSAGAGVRVQRVRGMLVVAEVALAVVLLVGAGLFTSSFVRVMRVDEGFDYHNVLTFDAGLRLMPGQKFDDDYAARNKQYTDQVIESLRHVPGVESVAGVDGGLPLTGSWNRNSLAIPGRGELRGENDDIDVRQVTTGYLQLLRIPLLKGRYLTADDRAGSAPVMVINETAARKYWPGQDPLGQHASVNEKDRVVVGVVGDIHHLGPEIAARQECYVPEAQGKAYGLDIVVRTTGDPMAVLPAAKAAVWAINREQRFTEDTFTLEGYLDRLIAQRRFNMAVLAIFGVLGLVIAAVGIYGVMAYVVAQRTNEIGVRMALGATRRDVVAMVIGRAGLLMIAGLAIGTVGAWYLSAGLKTFLFEIQPNDVSIFAVSVLVLAAAGLVASAVPARRAATVDPLVALRSE